MKRQSEGTETLDLAISLMPFSGAKEIQPQKRSSSTEEFECKTCNRKFSSFQALGGHRASHKKPRLDANDLKAEAKSLSLGTNKPKRHQCSICGLKFSLGQALGGHMRKHRDTAATNEGFPFINQVLAKVPVLNRSNSKRVLCLDLDLRL